MSQPTHLSLVTALIESLSDFSKITKHKATGQAVAERGKETPIIVMYASYPTGDALAWFCDDGKAHLYGLVNDNVKHIKSCLMTELPGLQEEAALLGKKFERKRK